MCCSVMCKEGKSVLLVARAVLYSPGEVSVECRPDAGSGRFGWSSATARRAVRPGPDELMLTLPDSLADCRVLCYQRNISDGDCIQNNSVPIPGSGLCANLPSDQIQLRSYLQNRWQLFPWKGNIHKDHYNGTITKGIVRFSSVCGYAWPPHVTRRFSFYLIPRAAKRWHHHEITTLALDQTLYQFVFNLFTSLHSFVISSTFLT